MAEADKTHPDINVKADVKTPISVAVGVSFAIVVFVLTMFLSIGGAYLIGVNNANNIKQNEIKFERAQIALHNRELVSSVKNSIPTCKALIKMDDAKDGATFPKYPGAKPGNGYGQKLAKSITDVVSSSGCRVLIGDIAKGESLMKIAEQMEKSDGS